nr:hypothetical protein [Mycoplasmopsis bovis]
MGYSHPRLDQQAIYNAIIIHKTYNKKLIIKKNNDKNKINK